MKNKQKTIKAWAIVNKKGKLYCSQGRGYWIFTTKRDAKNHCTAKDEIPIKIKINY